MSKKKIAGIVVGCIILICVVTAIVASLSAPQGGGLAEVRDFNVAPLTEVKIAIPLMRGEFLSGFFEVQGGSNNDISFYITDPYGLVVLCPRKIAERYNFAITAKHTGAYYLHFDNTFSLISDKIIRLGYRIR